MAIEPNPRPEASEADKEVLRKVYQDQLRDLKPQRDHAERARDEAARALTAAAEAHEKALYEHGVAQGKIDALRMLAARDGITDLD